MRLSYEIEIMRRNDEGWLITSTSKYSEEELLLFVKEVLAMSGISNFRVTVITDEE